MRLVYALIGSVIAVLAYIGGALPALAAGLGVVGVAVANTGSSILQALYSVAIVHRRFFRPPRTRPQTRPLRQLRESMPFFAVASSSSLINRADIVILSLFVPLGAVGIYSAGYLALDVCLLIPNAFGQAMYPELAETAATAPGDLRDGVRRHLRHTATLLASLTAAVWVAAPFVITKVFGAGFSESVEVLRITLPSLVLAAVTTTLGRAIFAAHGQADVAWASGAAAAFNIVANLALAPTYGIRAAAWITLATYGVTGALHWYFAGRRGCRPAAGDLFLPVAAGAASVAAVSWVSGDAALVAALAAAGVTYGLVAALWRVPALRRDRISWI
jgi:O-antigen/teichoic acid export membrane protein